MTWAFDVVVVDDDYDAAAASVAVATFVGNADAGSTN